MNVINQLGRWYGRTRGISKYIAFLKVANVKIPKHLEKRFVRGIRDGISHDQLRAEFIEDMGLKRDRK